MPNTTLYNMQGEKVGEIALKEEIFGITVSDFAMHTMVVNYLANQRQGTQSTKTRTEVRGGGRKPWRQKGTGRARQGSIRSPQWTGGGVALGPKPRSYRYSVNKKLRRLAMKSAFTTKVTEENLIVVDTISFEDYKTKAAAAMLDSLKVTNALVVLDTNDAKTIKSMNNIPNIKTAQVGTLNVYDMLRYDTLVLTKAAVEKIEEVYA